MKKQKQELKKYTAAESILEKEGYYIFYPDESPLKTQLVEERADLDREKQPQYVITEKIEKKPVITPDIPVEITEEKAVHYDLSTITSYLKWHMDRISKNVIGREEIVKQAMCYPGIGNTRSSAPLDESFNCGACFCINSTTILAIFTFSRMNS